MNKADKVLETAKELRDLCYEAISEGVSIANTDPGSNFCAEESEVVWKGNGRNAVDLLWLLHSLGVPGCRYR